jgi:phosphoribosylcarboxyaminoimidazole (NCAIR) mutase
VLKVRQVLKELKVQQDHKVLKAHKEHKVPKGQIQGLKERQVQQVLKVL